tara:strand:- start:97 stop:351 length:255 start_codon:yes stop_codon:yes gene_type:complete
MIEKGTVYPGMGMAEIEPGVFVGGAEYIKSVTLPKELGGKTVGLLEIKRFPTQTWYILDNISPNVVIDDGNKMLWANLPITEEE